MDSFCYPLVQRPRTGMILNVGIGVGVHRTVTLNADVLTDISKPKIKVENFLLSDVQNLPFRDNAFDLVYCHNVLEHVPDYIAAIRELKRTSRHIHLVQDRLWSIGSYQESSHLWWQGPHHKFYRYPRTKIGILLAKYLRKLESTYLSMWRHLHFTIWRPYYSKCVSIPHYVIER